MSSELKFKHHSYLEEKNLSTKNVSVVNLVKKLKEDQKQERNSNIALSVAAVSAVTVFGIILSL